ncbi:MAG: hypothetical protein IPJ38_23160 [Dechloromonas sp.]|uniref:Uncharacterized protein n=1 Tax=Candidatus Dechloromonas phosphorivorans TaxID=2899244 RepID=A0A935N003_9RHOO|nr:hypothetical protein [Candidatus Dechloromonas phosphorivorans]
MPTSSPAPALASAFFLINDASDGETLLKNADTAMYGCGCRRQCRPYSHAKNEPASLSQAGPSPLETQGCVQLCHTK